MKSLSEYMTKPFLMEATNSHSTHIADLMLYKGKQGVIDAIVTLKGIVRDLGNTQVPKITVKIDGSPALFCGHIDGKLFVATKAIFNKTPKLNFSSEDIRKNHSGDLGSTLEVFLNVLKGVVPNDGNVYQGDCLFTSRTKQQRTLNGVPSYCWQPNTILYSVPVNSELGAKVGKAQAAICFHTRYRWQNNEPSTLSVIDFNVRKEMFKQSSSVWISDPYLPDMTNAISLNAAQQAQIVANNREINSLLGSIDFGLITDKDVAPIIQIYINSAYKGNSQPFSEWLENRINTEMESKKTPAAKAGVFEKYKKVKNLTDSTMKAFFRVHSLLEESKLIVKALIDKISASRNFLVKADGSLVPTGNEGYCVVRGNAAGVKIVSRSEFSMANFSGDYLKGWSH